MKAFGMGPHVVERMLRVFPHDRLDDRIDPDRFTAREVIAHLADYEQFVLERFRSAKLKPGASVAPYDPDARAKEHNFGAKDIFREAEVFESRRMMTLDYLREFTEEDWGKTFVNAAGHAITARDYFAGILAHDIEHLDQLSSYLATEVATIA